MTDRPQGTLQVALITAANPEWEDLVPLLA
jgi:hypothetical protein